MHAEYAYPYSNGFESQLEQEQWTLTGSWSITNAQDGRGNYTGSYHLDNNPTSVSLEGAGDEATLNDLISIPEDAVRPVLSYWYQLHLLDGDRVSVQLRTAESDSWKTIRTYRSRHNHSGYIRADLSLSAYTGQSIQLRLVQRYGDEHGPRTWLIDDLSLGDDPPPTDLGYPYSNGFENQTDRAPWDLQGSWSILEDQSEQTSHAGSYHLNAAVTQGRYVRATLNGQVSIPADAVRPVLSYWYSLELLDVEMILVRVRTSDSSTWELLKFYLDSDTHKAYTRETLDLSAYKGKSIQLMFDQIDGDGNDSFIKIDDIYIGEEVLPDYGYPYSNEFESQAEQSQWNLQGSWGMLDAQGIRINHGGSYHLDNNPLSSVYSFYFSGQIATLNGTISIPADATQPVVSFWHILELFESDKMQVQVQSLDSTDWVDLHTYTALDNKSEYSREDLDLSAYKGQRIRLRFYQSPKGDGDPTAWLIDDLRVGVSSTYDQDGDGTPDFEDSDRDGDGFGNEEEIQAGTNPDNPQHYPDLLPPQLTLDGLTERVTDTASIDLRGGVSDGNSGLASLTLASDRFPGVAMAVIVNDGAWTANVPLEIGINLITLTASDHDGNQAQLGLSVERQSIDSAVALIIDYPQSGSVVNESEIVIRGLLRIETPAQDMSVTVDGAPLALTDTALNTEYRFESAPLVLNEGLNSFLVRGEADGQVASRQVRVTYQPEQQNPDAPQIRVLTPVSGSYLTETGFTLVGEIDAPGLLTGLTLNGTPVAFTDLHSGLYAFREAVGFDNGASQLTIDLVAQDEQGQSTKLQVAYLRDQDAPVIVIDQTLNPAPAENRVNEQPYRLQGRIVEANLSTFTINDTPVSLTPGDVDGEYRFDTALQLTPGESLPLILTAHDLAGNRSNLEYLLRLDTSLSLAMLLPAAGTELIQTGAPIPLQVAVEVSGVGAADALANAELHDAGGSLVATAALLGDAGVKGGEIELPAQAGEYEITVTLSDSGGQTLAVTHRSLAVKDPVEVPLALERIEPAAGQQGVEPNGFISLYFNQPIDIAELTLSVYETAHGYTYQDLDAPGTPALNAQGYQLVEISRSYEPVPGNFSLLPGDRVVAFYPSRELAYGAEVFVDISYGGEEIDRSLFRTRSLPTFINGSVVDQFGQPIPGIDVTIPALGRNTKTNSDGAFAFGYRDRYDQTIPGGRYELLINSGLAEPSFGSLVLWASVQEGRLNNLNVSRLPVLNKDVPFAPVEGRGRHSLLQGALNLDLSEADLLFPDGARQGDIHLQFSDYAQLPYPVGGNYMPHWVYTVQPTGVRVEGEIRVDIAMPSLNHTHNYLPDEGQYVLMLGADPQSRHIVPVGVARIENQRAISAGAQHYQVLDVFGYALVPREAQSHMQAYADGELELRQLLIALDNLTEQ